MAHDLYLTYPSEDWARTATFSATSEQVGYEAAKAKSEDPSEPWWANSGSGTLTATLSGSKEVGLIALIMTNADAGKVITIAGGITGSPTLTGVRYASGFPKDLVYIVEPAQTLSSVTFAISGNTNKWSIGRVVIGKRRSLTNVNFLDGFAPSPSRMQYSDENDFGHDIRYDLGVEQWGLDGELYMTVPNSATILDWWSSTRGGFYPTLIAPDSTLYPPFFVRMPKTLPRKHDNRNLRMTLKLTELSKGLEVVG
jgi:hypothetical protein